SAAQFEGAFSMGMFRRAPLAGGNRTGVSPCFRRARLHVDSALPRPALRLRRDRAPVRPRLAIHPRGRERPALAPRRGLGRTEMALRGVSRSPGRAALLAALQIPRL